MFSTSSHPLTRTHTQTFSLPPLLLEGSSVFFVLFPAFPLFTIALFGPFLLLLAGAGDGSFAFDDFFAGIKTKRKAE